MRKILGFFIVIFTITTLASDNIIVPSGSGNAYLKDASSNLAPFEINYTTDGNGHLQILVPGGGGVDDSLIFPSGSGKMYLSASGNLYPAKVIYTTDGSGHIQPVSLGSGGGVVSSVFTRTGAVTAQSGDYNTSQVTENTNLYFTTARARAAVSATAPIVDTAGVFSCNVSSGSQAGCLSSTDWSTFNSKQAALSFTSPLSNTSNTVSIPVATSGANGYLSSSDWSTFNGKQAAGSYITALTGDVTAAGPGSATATIAASAVTNSKIANSTIDLTAKVTGVLPAANGGGSPVTKNLFVDGSRTDSYTADGSQSRPFLTIGAAVSQIITNADNGTKQYTVNIVPGTYAETITLNNSALHSIVFTSTTGPGQIATQSTSVSGITSTSNNTQLATLIFSNITVNGNLNFTGDTNGTNFCSVQCVFAGSQFNNGSGTVTLNNVNNVSFYGGQIQGSGSVSTFTNCAFCYMEGAEGFIGGTTLHLVDNPGGNTPSQYSGNYFLMSGTKFYGTMTIDAGSELDTLQSYFGTTSAVTNNGTIHSWITGWAGSSAVVFNNGSVYRNRGDTVWVPHTFNSGSTIQNQDYIYMLGGVFGTSAVPATNALVVVKDGHYKSTQTTAPTAAPNANAGTGATCTVSNATDMAGTINLTTTAVSPASGAQCAVTFNKSYNVAPICTVTPANANAVLFSVTNGEYFTTTLSTLVVNYSNADSVGHSNVWSYHCVETQ